MMDNIAWHFTNATLRDGAPIPAIGETLIYKGRIKLCESGYHWSLKPHQALHYAPGNLLHMVRYGGKVFMGDDKGVSSERTILATIDAEHLMRRFAADQALSVAHLWDMPEVVKEYLTTLDESNRIAAWEAARAARAAAEAAYAAAYAADAYATRAAWAAVYAAYDATEAAREEFDRRVYAAFGVKEA
jgi:hypothetical protein